MHAPPPIHPMPAYVTFNQRLLPTTAHYAGHKIKVASLCGGGVGYLGHRCYVMQGQKGGGGVSTERWRLL